jgi:hypothetical protein
MKRLKHQTKTRTKEKVTIYLFRTESLRMALNLRARFLNSRRRKMMITTMSMIWTLVRLILKLRMKTKTSFSQKISRIMTGSSVFAHSSIGLCIDSK